jgi:Tol biopolymer transport system component
VNTIGPFPFQNFGAAELSWNGEHIAMQSPNGPSPDAEIWLFDLLRRQAKQLTFSAGEDRHPVWSPDGDRVVFASRRQGASGLYQKSAGGEQREELLLRSQSDVWIEHWPVDWSSRGIVYESGRDRSDLDLWILPVDGDRKPYPVVREPGSQQDAKISRDGRWLAYTHDEPPHRPEVFVQSLLKAGTKWRISTAGGRWPQWRSDGKELFYLAADGNLIAVPIEADAVTLRPGVPETLFRTGLSIVGGTGYFAVSPDGQRFLIRTAEDPDEVASIIVLANWPAVLKR